MVIETRDRTAEIADREQGATARCAVESAQGTVNGHRLGRIFDGAGGPETTAGAQRVGGVTVTGGDTAYGVVIIGTHARE